MVVEPLMTQIKKKPASNGLVPERVARARSASEDKGLLIMRRS